MHKDININVSGPVQTSSQYNTVVLKGQVPFATQVTEQDTKYVIKYNFDLDGESVTIPAGCILEFDGGSLSNGTIVGNSTKLSNVGNIDIFQDITKEGTFIDLITRSPSYLDFEQSSSYEEGYIYNDRVVRIGQIFTLDMILPAGRWTYAFNLIGEDGVWFGDGTTEITIRNRDNNTIITPVSSGYDDQDTYNNASRYWLSFYLPQMTKVRIELDDPAQATLYLYRPCLNMGYNRMTIADAAAQV